MKTTKVKINTENAQIKATIIPNINKYYKNNIDYYNEYIIVIQYCEYSYSLSKL